MRILTRGAFVLLAALLGFLGTTTLAGAAPLSPSIIATHFTISETVISGHAKNIEVVLSESGIPTAAVGYVNFSSPQGAYECTIELTGRSDEDTSCLATPGFSLPAIRAIFLSDGHWASSRSTNTLPPG